MIRNSFNKLFRQPRLTDLFANESKSEFPDFAIRHAPEELIEDQSRVFDREPFYGRVAAFPSESTNPSEDKQNSDKECE